MAKSPQLSEEELVPQNSIVNIDPNIPTYSISRGVDGILQFDPPVDDEQLAIALSYHFPRPTTLESKMQAAIRIYLDELSRERKSNAKALTAGLHRQTEGQQHTGDTNLTNESNSANPSLSTKIPFNQMRTSRL